MINRWYSFLLVAALLQGCFSASPIPEILTMEEEWTQFAERLGNPEFRLPTTTVPRHYEVFLTPYFDTAPANISPFTFTGSVVIYLSATEANVNEIVMHSNDLMIQSLSVSYINANGVEEFLALANQQPFVLDPTLQFLRISTSTSLLLNQEYIVRINFEGILQTNMRGFYRSWYRDSSGLRWMATTQFQPGHARQAFPCYDEPRFKATFDISISREEGFQQTISNMPIRAASQPANGRVTETFHRTPRTSTYLLAFIVSHYREVAVNNNPSRPFQIYARDNIGSDGLYSLEVGQLLLEQMEQYTQIPYYTVAENMNMKQAAIPDFSAGAMENWGLLTYREALLLFNEAHTNHFYRQRISNIISHEIAHMWFGNLVTCAWWDNLWLNEGFARYYQYYLTDFVQPELGFATRFIVEQVQVAMLSDSLPTAHALTDSSVTDPTSVSLHFSTITYAKGAAVLRMTEHLLGYTTYVTGLRRYLMERAFDVAEPHHLFSALDAVAIEENALGTYDGITIDSYFRTWTEQVGYPIVNVDVDHVTGSMTVTQNRWDSANGALTDDPSLWHIPISWAREANPNFVDPKPSQFLSGRSATIERGTRGNEWVIFNIQQTGFYRVNYDETTWNLLTRALRGVNRNVIHEYNRAQIVDDLFALARAGDMTYTKMFNIISFLEFETSYAPWIAAINGFQWVLRRLAHDATATGLLKNLIIKDSEVVMSQLGWAETLGSTYMTDFLRFHLAPFLCNVGHEQCVSTAQTHFQDWRTSQTNIPPNLRPWVYCIGLRTGTAADFDYFWSRYLEEQHASEQVVMLQVAGCTLDQNSLVKFWEAITEPLTTHPAIIRPQDLSVAVNSAITGNEENTMRSFNWISNNIERTSSSAGLNTALNTIIQRLLTAEQIHQVETWLTQNQAVLGESAYNTGVSAIAVARGNIAWHNARVAEFNTFFENGYVEIPIEEITEAPPTLSPTTLEPTTTPAITTADPTTIPPTTVEPTTAEPTTVEPTTAEPTTVEPTTVEMTTTAEPTTIEPTTVEPTTAEPDSANVAALSFMTLLITISINFLA